MTTLHDFGGVLGQTFGHFLLGSHNFMVMALGPCVKWPLVNTKGCVILGKVVLEWGCLIICPPTHLL